MAGGGKRQAKQPRAEERMAAASPVDSAEGSGEGSTSVAADELALVPAKTAMGRGGGVAVMEDLPATSGGSGGDDAAAEEEDAMAWRCRGRQGRDLPARTETVSPSRSLFLQTGARGRALSSVKEVRNASRPDGAFLASELRRHRPSQLKTETRPHKWTPFRGVMRPRTMWPLVVAAYRGLPAFQRERVIRDRWDRVSRTFLFPWGHMVPSLEDVARITGLWVDGEAVTGVTYADYTDLTQQLLGLEQFGQDDHERRMVGRVALLQSLGLAGVRQKADELLPAFVEHAAGLARATYGQDAEDTVRADRDLRQFLVFFFGKMLFTTKGDGIHCRFLELLDDLMYAWGAALLAHTFADLSTGTGRKTTVGGFAPFLHVWSYYYLPLGRAIEVDPTAVSLARRWLPLVSTATYAFQLDTLRRHVRDCPALLVVWEPYVGYGDADQPWVVSGRGLFRRDIWVHCLNEIEPLRLRLAARTLGLHQHWIDEAEPKGIGRKTRGKAKPVDWRTRFPEQFSDWHHGGQVVTSDATDSTAYLQRYQEEYGLRDFMRPERDGRDTLIGQLEGQLAATTVQLAEARAALETL
ncbi:hypothetical protein Taro_052877, partial [Colocasia esculenta]|nr:hypothetical protein [Colocasia esculenta]